MSGRRRRHPRRQASATVRAASGTSPVPAPAPRSSHTARILGGDLGLDRDGHRVDAEVEVGRVDARPAVQVRVRLVVVAEDDVVAAARDQRVDAGAADELVIAFVPGDRVVARAARDRVVAVATREHVVPGAAEQVGRSTALPRECRRRRPPAGSACSGSRRPRPRPPRPVSLFDAGKPEDLDHGGSGAAVMSTSASRRDRDAVRADRDRVGPGRALDRQPVGRVAEQERDLDLGCSRLELSRPGRTARRTGRS